MTESNTRQLYTKLKEKASALTETFFDTFKCDVEKWSNRPLYEHRYSVFRDFSTLCMKGLLF